MRFSEHGASSSGALACWSGIGLYDWNGSRLTSCRVEQDFWSQRRQLATGVPDALEPPHLDPWVTLTAQPPDPAAESTVRAWLAAADLAAVEGGRIDAGSAQAYTPILEPEVVEVLDLFSAGDRVAFHATVRGTYLGGLDGVDGVGGPAGLDVAGLATVEADRIVDLRAVTDRFGTSLAIRSAGAAP